MKDGIEALYSGELAEKIEREIKDGGGIVTAQDMSDYRATMRDPLITKPGEVNGFTMGKFQRLTTRHNSLLGIWYLILSLAPVFFYSGGTASELGRMCCDWCGKVALGL
jgi:hypothetical protein